MRATHFVIASEAKQSSAASGITGLSVTALCKGPARTVREKCVGATSDSVADIDTSGSTITLVAMRCYSVLLVGNLTYHLLTDAGAYRPIGYSVVRYVLARDEGEASLQAIKHERKILSRDRADVRKGLVSVMFEASEIHTAPFRRLLRPRYGRAYFMTN